jgi:16S rRNA (adenine1518-N6/adenine1519-N6)-dimethyltransferase
MRKKGARLGQHFLIHAWPASKLAHSVGVREGETILEIGPGKGILTRELLKQGSVVAIEKDPALVEKLHETFADDISSGRLKIIEADVRDIVVEPLKVVSGARRGESDARGVGNPTMSASLRLRNNADDTILSGEYVVAANIPYYITGEFIRQFLTAQVQPRAMALLVQKEVADRIVAKKESILSLSVKAYGSPRIIAKVGASHFSPPPSVDSAILLIDDISKNFFESVSEERFFSVIRGVSPRNAKCLRIHSVISSAKKRCRFSLFAAIFLQRPARKIFRSTVGSALLQCEEPSIVIAMPGKTMSGERDTIQK